LTPSALNATIFSKQTLMIIDLVAIVRYWRQDTHKSYITSRKPTW